LTERLENLCLNIGGGEEVVKESSQCSSMFKRMLVENRQCFDPEHMLVSSIAINAGSEVSLGDESFEDSLCRYGVTRNSRGIHH
jgi:hypothetical protein